MTVVSLPVFGEGLVRGMSGAQARPSIKTLELKSWSSGSARGFVTCLDCSPFRPRHVGRAVQVRRLLGQRAARQGHQRQHRDALRRRVGQTRHLHRAAAR